MAFLIQESTKLEDRSQKLENTSSLALPTSSQETKFETDKLV